MVVGKAACVKRKFDVKKFLIPLLAASALAGAAVPAAAAPWMNINERQAQLDQRIDAGVRNGSLTRREARSLRAEFQDIAGLEYRYRRTGGHRQIETVIRVTSVSGAGLSETWDGTVDFTPRAILNAKARGLTNLVAELEAAHAPVVVAPTADAAPAKKPRAKKAAPAADASEGAEA